MPLGWFAYEETSQIRTLIIIVLKKEYLGLGYGSAVMETFLNDCRKNRIRTIYLNVNENNIRAIQYYKKFGFEIYDLEIVSKTNNKINNREYKMKLEMH